MANLSNAFFTSLDERGYVPSKEGLTGGFDPTEMGRYWAKHREFIREKLVHVEERYVFTSNYIASYSEHLDGVFSVLDELAVEAIGAAAI